MAKIINKGFNGEIRKKKKDLEQKNQVLAEFERRISTNISKAGQKRLEKGLNLLPAERKRLEKKLDKEAEEEQQLLENADADFEKWANQAIDNLRKEAYAQGYAEGKKRSK